MIVFDTNVLSELMRPQPNPQVLAWSNRLDPLAIAITAMNEAEILQGIARLPNGWRQKGLQQSWQELMASMFGGQALPFTSEAAQTQRVLFRPLHRERAGGRHQEGARALG